MDPTDEENANKNVWWCISTLLKPLSLYKENFKNKNEQAGAVLDQAQLKLGFDFTSINLHSINDFIAISIVLVQLPLNFPVRTQPTEVSHG